MRCAFVLFVLLALGAGVLGKRRSKGKRHDLHNYVLEDEIGAISLAIGAGTDPNLPNENGHLALVTAVVTEKPRIADFLLAYGANSSTFEPASQRSAIVAAFSEGYVGMSRLLLQYGASPDIKDAKGATARSVAPDNPQFAEILKAYDNSGAMAFEDAPGTWSKHISEDHDGATFYFNKETKEATFHAPPSCGWSKVDIEGHSLYFNTITGQQTWKRPDAVAWRRVVEPESGEVFWLNYRTKAAVRSTPAELSGDLLAEARAEAGTFWFNPLTKEHSWEDPNEDEWKKAFHPESGNHYYFHHEKGSTWEPPEQHAWEEHKVDEHNVPFYHSKLSGESQWEKPAALSWIKETMFKGDLKALADEF